jgi:diphthamide synthase (EF-2-diphthine--ammonia ligase)
MYIASWSGGKDSCLACYLAIKKGMKISHLLHFDRPNNLHGVDPAMIRLQAELAGIPIVQRKVASEDFEREFKKTVGELAKNRTCGDLGIEPIEPLWGMKTENIMKDFFNLGFETIVASGNQKLIDKKYIGRKMDRDFIEYLKSKNLDVCGESGEFHTFVTSGPLFQGTIEIADSAVTSWGGFWFLDVRKYEVIRKTGYGEPGKVKFSRGGAEYAEK